MYKTIYFAVPASNEYGTINQLIDCILSQTYQNLKIIVCVNQPECYRTLVHKENVSKNNEQTLEYLSNISDKRLEIIDFASAGRGLAKHQAIVGWVRRHMIERICEKALDDDIIVSMDADCRFQNYFTISILNQFKKYPNAIALCNPYYHPLTNDINLDSKLLRYETYMRWYTVNLLRIESPYAYTALGSVIIFPVSSYKKIKTFAPRAAGEDFYLLQKFRKNGQIILYNTHLVYPATRYSDRVPFGTGPALISELQHQSEMYPFYSGKWFDKIRDFYQTFQFRFNNIYSDEFDVIIEKIFNLKSQELWHKLRKNNPTLERFIHACHCKFDALWTFKTIRHFHQNSEKYPKNITDEYLFLLDQLEKNFFEFRLPVDKLMKLVYFDLLYVQKILRDILFQVEMNLRNKRDLKLKANKQYNIWKYLN